MSLNPHKLRLANLGCERLEKKRMIIDNANAFNIGKYTMEALEATVGNMFRKKGSQPHKYPEKPYELDFRTEEQKKEDAIASFRKKQEENRRKWRKKHNKDKSGAD